MTEDKELKAGTWLKDVWEAVLKLEKEDFTLKDLYQWKKEFALRHPENHNVEARIRATLQELRDLGRIEFRRGGLYRVADSARPRWKEFSVVIEETVAQRFKIVARSAAEALEKAKAGYRDCRYVLEPGDLVDLKFSVEEEEETA